MQFTVRLTRDATESLDLVVEAETAEQAEEMAVKLSGRYGELVGGWELDEGNQHEVCVSDEPTPTEDG